MPLYKRRPFSPSPLPPDLRPDEEVYYLRLTNEIFREYDSYYSRVILCNSMVWSCSLTGKANLTFQEALDSERAAKKALKGFPKELKHPLLLTSTQTSRSRLNDVVDDVLAYARDRYFIGEEVLSVIGNMWCPSRVLQVIHPTKEQVDAYRVEQEEKGEAENNDYLKDDTWGPSPDLFKYKVEELDPDDPKTNPTYILDAIDVKREKAALTRDKCRILLKLAMDFDENGKVEKKWVLREGVRKEFFGGGVKEKEKIWEGFFGGKLPVFENTAVVVGKVASSGGKVGAEKNGAAATGNNNRKNANEMLMERAKKRQKKLTPEELKKLELEQKAQEKEKQKAQKKKLQDFKKIWLKPKEDLEVEDLKDLPHPDPITTPWLPNHLFGDFMMILEFTASYSQFLKVKDSFPGTGLTFDQLEQALTKNHIAGSFSELLQILLRAIFRLQEGEAVGCGEEHQEEQHHQQSESTNQTSSSSSHQNHPPLHPPILSTLFPLHKLPTLDHSSLSEILRLHLLSSLLKSQKSTETEEPAIQLHQESPEILDEKLSKGTVFELSLEQRIKLIHCLMHQIMSYPAVKDLMEESYDAFKAAKTAYRALLANEKKREAEDHLWRQKLKTDRQIPDPASLLPQEKQPQSDEKKAPPPQSKKPPLTDPEIESLLLKRDKETARRKQDFLYKESDLLGQISKHERKLGGHPLGRDRAYRRYWTFNSINGFFVENDDEFVGVCCARPTPHVGEVNLEDPEYLKSDEFGRLQSQILNNKSEENNSDKENASSSSSKKSKKSSPSKPIPIPPPPPPQQPPIFGLCTANPTTCPVHSSPSTNKTPKPKWSFFSDPSQIDALLAGLSPRGIREKELKSNIEEAKDYLKTQVKKCNVQKLNTEKNYLEGVDAGEKGAGAERRTSQRAQHQGGGGGGGMTGKAVGMDPNLGFPEGTPMGKIMNLHLRDLVLEFEEKIFLGGLGVLRVPDRSDWRLAIESSSYRAGVDALQWGAGAKEKVKKIVQEEGGGEEEEKEEEEDEKMIVQNLACAILQIQQAVEVKFMKRPLVDREDDTTNPTTKKKKNPPPPAAESWKSVWNSTTTTTSLTPLERWQISLMKSTSFSQLFVHFYLLESSIEWSRSVLNARCRVCRRKGDPENMLLCDSCNKGHHIYCLKPALDAPPKGDWFCRDCKRDEEPLPTPSKKRRNYYEEEIVESEEENNDNDDTLKDEDENDNENSNAEPEVCFYCEYGGEVVCCDFCPKVFHLLCLDPPRTRVPRGVWACPECGGSGGGGKKGNVKGNKNKKKGGGKKKGGSRGRKKMPTKRRLKYQEESSTEEESEEEEDSEIEEEEEEEEEVEDKVVKVKFSSTSTSTTKKPPSPTPSSSTPSSRSSSPSSSPRRRDEESLPHHSKRKCASEAAARITKAAKRLGRSESNESSTSSSSDLFAAKKRAAAKKRGRVDDSDNEDDDDNDNDNEKGINSNGTKRTRFSSSAGGNTSTVRKTRGLLVTENGELDNVMLDKLISDIMKHPDAWPFLKPVTKSDAPDYFTIIRNPMDLGTIKYKLNSMVYTCNEELISDLLLVFTNCFTYNDEANHVHQLGQQLKEYCEGKCRKLGINFEDPVKVSKGKGKEEDD